MVVFFSSSLRLSLRGGGGRGFSPAASATPFSCGNALKLMHPTLEAVFLEEKESNEPCSARGPSRRFALIPPPAEKKWILKLPLIFLCWKNDGASLIMSHHGKNRCGDTEGEKGRSRRLFPGFWSSVVEGLRVSHPPPSSWPELLQQPNPISASSSL